MCRWWCWVPWALCLLRLTSVCVCVCDLFGTGRQVVSSVRAYINALNKMIAYVAQRQGQETELGSSGDSYSSVDLDNSKAASV